MRYLRMPGIHVFVFLQLVDFLTTMIGLQLGAGEISPFIRHLMVGSPVAGVASSKLLALVLVSICVWLHKHRLITWANYWYSALAIWNLGVICMLLRGR